MARRAAAPAGPKCRHRNCGEPIRKTGDKLAPWVHVANGNVFCADNLDGHTARFAEPS